MPGSKGKGWFAGAALALWLVPPPAAAQSYPVNDSDWLPVSKGGGSLWVSDPGGDAQPGVDLAGDLNYPLAYVQADASYLYFRIRLDGDPYPAALLYPGAWGVIFQATSALQRHEGSIFVDNVSGDSHELKVRFNAADDPPPNDGINDPADDPPEASLPIASYSRYTPASGSSFQANSDYFFDWAVPRIYLAPLDPLPTLPLRFVFGSSTDGRRLNDDRVEYTGQLTSSWSDPYHCEDTGCQRCDNDLYCGGRCETCAAGEHCSIVAGCIECDQDVDCNPVAHEVCFAGDCIVRESDGDGIPDWQEDRDGTNPFDADTDHDGVGDGDDLCPTDPGGDPDGCGGGGGGGGAGGGGAGGGGAGGGGAGGGSGAGGAGGGGGSGGVGAGGAGGGQGGEVSGESGGDVGGGAGMGGGGGGTGAGGSGAAGGSEPAASDGGKGIVSPYGCSAAGVAGIGWVGLLAVAALLRRRRGAGLLVLALLFPGAARADEGKQLKVAVLDLKAGPGVEAGTAELVTERLAAAIGRRPGLQVISSREIRTMVGFEKEKALLGCTEDSCLAEIGGSLGVDRLVTGSLGRLGDTLVFSAQVLDIRKAIAAGRFSADVKGGDEALLGSVEQAAEELFPAGGKRLVARGGPGAFGVGLRLAAEALEGGGFGGIYGTWAPAPIFELSLGPVATPSGFAGGSLRATLVPLRPTEALSVFVGAEGTGLFGDETLAGVGGAVGVGYAVSDSVQLAVEAPVVHYLDGPETMKRNFLFGAVALGWRP